MTTTDGTTIVTGVDFAAVPTKDLERAAAFYGEALGLRRSMYKPETLEDRGVTFEGDIFDTGVCHMAFFADPDGNALMLHHRYAPRTAEA